VILARSPLRITLGGGGTDLKPYVDTHGGFCVTAAINKYVYVSVTKPFTPGIYLKYSNIEHVERVDQVQHPIIKAALQMLDILPQIEITTLADIPSGTGLGSSSAFTCALLAALYAFRNDRVSAEEVAEVATSIERSVHPEVGCQDTYASAYGGIRSFTIPDNLALGTDVYVKKVLCDWPKLERRLMLFYTGVTRNAESVLRESLPQPDRYWDGVCAAGLVANDALRAGDFDGFARSLNDQFWFKEKRSPSSPVLRQGRNYLMAAGAEGVKLVGAGQGGFFLAYAPLPEMVRNKDVGFVECPFRFDHEGTKLLVVE
jgi:D-glycero-alpha-D-manno-heptose-7-phosphate kinase